MCGHVLMQHQRVQCSNTCILTSELPQASPQSGQILVTSSICGCSWNMFLDFRDLYHKQVGRFYAIKTRFSYLMVYQSHSLIQLFCTDLLRLSILPSLGNRIPVCRQKCSVLNCSLSISQKRDFFSFEMPLNPPHNSARQ